MVRQNLQVLAVLQLRVDLSDRDIRVIPATEKIEIILIFVLYYSSFYISAIDV